MVFLSIIFYYIIYFYLLYYLVSLCLSFRGRQKVKEVLHYKKTLPQVHFHFSLLVPGKHFFPFSSASKETHSVSDSCSRGTLHALHTLKKGQLKIFLNKNYYQWSTKEITLDPVLISVG